MYMLLCTHTYIDAVMHVCALYGLWLTTPNPDIAVSSHFFIRLFILCMQTFNDGILLCVLSYWNVVWCQYDNMNVSTSECLQQIVGSVWLCCHSNYACTYTLPADAHTHTHTHWHTSSFTHTHTCMHIYGYFLGNLVINIFQCDLILGLI